MVPVVLVFLVVLELPGPEIRILQEISSPELAGNRGGTKPRVANPRVGSGTGFGGPGGGSGGPGGGFVIVVKVMAKALLRLL